MNARLTLSLLATTAMLAGTPALAQSRDGTPGNPPSTATGRAVDAAQGRPSQPDGTPGNPPGTAAERAIDRATGSNMSGANPSGSAANDSGPAATSGSPAGTTAQGGTTATPAPSASTATTATTRTTTTAEAADEARNGLRASRIIGANIYNEQNESVGEVDDLMLQREGGPAVAIISVGGFLGIGARNVAVPFTELRHDAERDRWVLPGATKDALKERPAFAYGNTRSGAPATGEPAASRPASGGGRGAADAPAPAPAPRQ